MRRITDADTRTFTDPSGDTLTLLIMPRYGDKERADEVARDEAYAALSELVAAGMDVDKILADAQADEAVMEAAQVAASKPSPGVSEARFKALARRVDFADGSAPLTTHQALIDFYHEVDPETGAWIADCVNTAWDSAIPSDADTRGETAGAVVLPEPESAA
jgi:hypothetical protein